MSQILHLQEKLQDVSATMGRLEMELARHPESAGLAANMRSLRKLHANLSDDFAYAANQIGLDVLHYRVLEERPTARALSGSVGTFQEAISVAYDAFQHGPKMRRVLTPLIAQETALQVAYSYPGSFGVVFTIPNQRLLLENMSSQLDMAVQTVLDLGKSYNNTSAISEVERRLGKATISAVYSWAQTNSENRIGAAIEWRRNELVRAEVLIQELEFRALSETLESIARKTDKELNVVGVLVGANTSSHRFDFIVRATDDHIRGRFEDAISDSQSAEVPRKYRAFITQTTETTYATEEEKITYFLNRLEPI
jgi:hypothetical protein